MNLVDTYLNSFTKYLNLFRGRKKVIKNINYSNEITQCMRKISICSLNKYTGFRLQRDRLQWISPYNE